MHPEQPFFIASIDKLFTAVEMAKFVEEGKLSFDDFISSYLEPDLLHGLHRIDGKEYTDEIQIKHLLNHTSGLFGDAMERPADGETLLDLLLDESTEPLTPHKILQWAKENLQTKYPPGEKFSYSDIGYYLLILILEKYRQRLIVSS